MDGQGVDARVGDGVPTALEGDEVVRPQRSHHFDLLFGAAAPVGEVLVQRLVLHAVPAYADAETEAAFGEDVDLGGLLGDEGGLTLWEDEDAGYELDLLRQSGKVAEQHEGFVEGVRVSIGASEPLVGLAIGAENVVIDEEVVVTKRLCGLGIVADCDRVVADFELRKYYSDLHAGPPGRVSPSLYATG